MFRNVFLNVLLVLGLVVAAPLTAQGGGGLFFDTVDVNVVNVDVMVTDKDGNPITDLTRDDFEVLEDDQPVEVTNFFTVVDQRASLDIPSAGGLEMVDTAPETRQLRLVVFIDNLNSDPRNRNVILENLRGFLRAEFNPEDEVMLAVLNDTVEIEQPFTNDVKALEAAIDRLEGNLGQGNPLWGETRRYMAELQRAELIGAGDQTSFNLGSGADSQGDFNATAITAERLGQTAKNLAEQRLSMVRATVSALGQFTDSLTGLPGRKAILYVSDGLHVRPAESLAEAFQAKYNSWLLENGQTVQARDVDRVTRELQSLNLDATKDFQQLVEYASSNRVSFYPLSNLGRFSETQVSAAIGGSNSTDGQGPYSAAVTSFDTMSRESSLVHMADGTGGRAFTRTSNIAGLFQAVKQDFRTFYSIGYDSPSPSDSGKFHKIKVKVKRPNVQVRHLIGHIAKDPLDHLQALTLSALHFGSQDNPLEVTLSAGAQTPVEGKKNKKKQRYKVPLTVQIPFGKLLLLPEEEFHTGRVSLFIVVRDEDGGVSKPQHIELPIQVPNDRIFDAITQAVGYPVTLELEEGTKRIAIGIRDNLARQDSTLNVDLLVGEATDAAGS